MTEDALLEFDSSWTGLDTRLEVIPGKEALGMINQHLQAQYGISVTATAIIDAMQPTEIAEEMRGLIRGISQFVSSR
jgi:hypothetical protein